MNTTIPSQDPTLQRFEHACAAPRDTVFELTLFVSGASDLSARAIANARSLCDLHLPGRHHLAVVDVQKDPAAVLRSGVLAAPTLRKTYPLPVRLFVGDLSRTERVLLALGLVATKSSSEAHD